MTLSNPSSIAGSPSPSTDGSESSPDVVLAELARMVREVIGEAWADDLDIGMETSFSGDLELESIEFVALAEKLKQRYGRRVDFAGWLAQKELDEILGLEVGTLVEHIVSCLSKPTPA